MNLLVIGNGFDLAHKLPTQYSDFLDFIKAFNEPDNSNFSDIISNIKTNKADLYSEICGLIESNILITYFLSIYEDRCQKGKRGWIDFESEISILVQKFDEAKQYVKSMTSGPGEHVILERGLFQYLGPIIVANWDASTGTSRWPVSLSFLDYQADRLLDALNRLTRLLEIYLCEFVETMNCVPRLPELKSLNIEYVLSFNYTDTYRKYYDNDSNVKYCFIHGKAKESRTKPCNLVLGIDEYLPYERKNLDNQFIWFKKFYQRIYKETDSEYLDWISDFERLNSLMYRAKPSKLNLYIYGHSLDVTDKDVLERLIMMENSKTYIYYHNRNSMASQISNLVKVIGEENLIQKTGGKDRTIRFIQAQSAV